MNKINNFKELTTKILSWNVNGLGDKIKRGIVTRYIKRIGPDIALLQETHMLGNAGKALDRNGYKMIAHSGFMRGSRGVGILSRKSSTLSVSKTWSDPRGRFIIISGTINGKNINIGSVYAPPRLHEQTLSEIGKILLQLPEGHIIIGGDLNITLDNEIDRLPVPTTPQTKKPLQDFLNAMGLADIWRTQHPNLKQYTYLSGAHGSLSRIDHLLTTHREVHLFKDTRHLARGISDHSPMWTEYSPLYQSKRLEIQINPWHLKIPQIKNNLITAVERYFVENSGSVSSGITLWEAFKPVIKGQSLSITVGYKREKNLVSELLEKELQILEKVMIESPSAATIHAINVKKKEYLDVATEAAKAAYLATQHRLYEVGNKAGKLIAWLDRREEEGRWIHEIKNHKGETATDPKEIAEIFSQHYTQVYKKSIHRPATDNRELINNWVLPAINEEDSKILEKEITIDEIEKTIHDLPSGKTPGPNGIPIELYKLASEILAPHLFNMFTESKKKGCLPRDQRLATIVVIHKQGKPHDECSSYRPISLIGAEAKILAKLLANRLIKVITKLIHPDQSGFMPGRCTAFNLRHLHGVLAKATEIKEDVAILSLDAQMAFDTVEWSFMTETLRKFGLGPQFMGWIQLLYTLPLAQVRVNNIISPLFPLERGTRQGCPLSPLLFALTIEPLAAWIRSDPLIRGLNWDGTWDDCISLYADDILLYMADPSPTLDRILHILKIYGSYSGFTINWTKSSLYVLHGATPIVRKECNIPVTAKSFKYLGIHITTDKEEFFRLNLSPPLERLKKDVSHWRSLSLSLLGRAALYKMMSLPRLLYALQNTPYLVPNSYFASINSEVRKLIWDGTPPRIALHKLCQGWYEGGIALPDIQKYYWAAHLTAINQWAFLPQDEPSLRMDRLLLKPTGYLGKIYGKQPTINQTSPTQVAVKIWHDTLQALKWEGKLTQATPLWDTAALGNLRSMTRARGWDTIGISTLGEVWRNGGIVPWDELKSEYRLAPNEVFLYMQVRHALKARLPEEVALPETSPLEARLFSEYMPKKAISLTYRKILNNTPEAMPATRKKWTQDLGELTDEEWGAAVASPREVGIRAGFRLVQLKILHRIYYTPSLLFRMGKKISYQCNRNCEERGTFYHTIWSCPYIVHYWTNILNCINGVNGIDTNMTPSLCLLNIWGATDLSRAQRLWTTLGLGIAKRNIARKWGSDLAPLLNDWKKDMDWCMLAEKVIYESRGCPQKWKKIWEDWNEYRGGIVSNVNMREECEHGGEVSN